MSEPMPSMLAFEKRYDDGSGIEKAVRFRGEDPDDAIQFELIDSVSFPIEDLDWLIACLQKIKRELGLPEE